MESKDFKISKTGQLLLIAGPCVIESQEHAIQMGKAIRDICNELGIDYVYKSSFDKANRTSVSSYRGPGLKNGLDILQKVKAECGIKITSDIHNPNQAKEAAKVLDVIQIPAFLCRQTDLLVEAGKTNKPVNIKKGQFMSPDSMKSAITKVYQTGNKQVMVTERGSVFGYNNLVVDFRSIPIIKGLGVPLVYDATHSLQLPGSLGTSTGGLRQYIPHLARAAVAVGADALFLEVHDNPNNALCDATTQFPLSELKELLVSLLKIKKALKNV